MLPEVDAWERASKFLLKGRERACVPDGPFVLAVEDVEGTRRFVWGITEGSEGI